MACDRHVIAAFAVSAAFFVAVNAEANGQMPLVGVPSPILQPRADEEKPGTPPRPEVPSPAGDSKPTIVTNVFFDTDLRQALADVSAQTGAIIIPDESVQGIISIELKDVPLKEALELMLAPGGYVCTEIRPGVHFIASPDPDSPAFRLIARAEVVALDYIESEELQLLLPDMYIKYVKVDKVGNRVVVTAPDELRSQCIEQIKTLDVPPLQILIESMVVETSADALKEFELSLQGEHLGMSLGNTAMITYVGQAEALLHKLTWMVQHGSGEIRANPRVIAQEGQEAMVSVAIEQYFQVVSGRVGWEYVNLEQIDATMALTITPRVAEAARHITCTIKPEVSDVTGTGPNNLPIITRRTAETTVRVGDGEVIAIGGLLQELERESKSKIPILGDIPLIGSLFRSSRKTSVKREIVIFVVPHILGPDGRYEGPSLLESLGSESLDRPGPPESPSTSGQSGGTPR